MNTKKIIGTIGQNNSKKVIDNIITSTSKSVEETSKVVSSPIVAPVVTPVVKEVNKHEDKKVVNTTATRVAAKTVAPKAKSTRTAPKVEQKRAVSKSAKSTKTTKTTTKKAVASKVEKINYEEILGSEPIKLIISKEKKVTDYKITVAIRNYNYDKYVYVKYSEDNWKTEKKADLSFKSSEENNIEIWSTSIKINPKKVDDFKFAVAYAVNDEEFWDNNYGQDYTF